MNRNKLVSVENWEWKSRTEMASCLLHKTVVDGKKKQLQIGADKNKFSNTKLIDIKM